MISVTILTKDSEKHLKEVLDSTKSFDEVLILDTGSTDSTLTIASEYPNVVIHHSAFTGFGPLHNKMVDLAKNDWILSLDSDEVMSPELIREIEGLSLDPHTVYSIKRHNTYNNRYIRGCGWHPDYVKRLFHRKQTRFCDALVHESVQSKGMKNSKLKASIKHFSYDCTSDFLKKMQTYSELYASQNKGKKSSSLGRAVAHALFAFFKTYIIQYGFMAGREGFIISVYHTNITFYKHLKLAGY